ncbi:Rieske (2Fe-2S) protein [Mobilicoccus pelagius]|uniref:Putative iron-sulfur protein n=1 Tax=Mobilicoccus pelagius NBRC 104925 TaxID=1089455 RepID=H5UTP9_9MICO|nr:Rieske (2Fe-2S) protein [Mobilicoccus pelagius]GAB49107.1 putative iron-sulfur protein [Mobilicoccus pelagius NBRC 104925]
MTELQSTPVVTTEHTPTGVGAETRPSRRTVLRMVGVGGAIATVTFVAGCGSKDEKKGGAASPEETQKVQTAVQKAVSAGQVPVGGGLVLEDVGAVVTQPSAGEYNVFSTYCPHAGGRVTAIEEGSGRPVCVLHGSVFDSKSGEVVAGPSPAGLTRYDVALGGATPTS